MVELVFPLSEGQRWYLNATMQARNPNFEVDSMLRQVEEKRARQIAGRTFADCYLMTDIVGGTQTTLWYCSGVGIVERAEDHHGTPYGIHEVLINYTQP